MLVYRSRSAYSAYCQSATNMLGSLVTYLITGSLRINSFIRLFSAGKSGGAVTVVVEVGAGGFPSCLSIKVTASPAGGAGAGGDGWDGGGVQIRLSNCGSGEGGEGGACEAGGVACRTPPPLTLSPAFSAPASASASVSASASASLRATPAAKPVASRATEIVRQGKRPPRLQLTALASAPVEKRGAGVGDAEAEPLTVKSGISESLKDTCEPLSYAREALSDARSSSALDASASSSLDTPRLLASIANSQPISDANSNSLARTTDSSQSFASSANSL